MVGKRLRAACRQIVATTREISTDGLGARVGALPGFAAARTAAERAGAPAYLVGGAVRDTLLGRPALQLDLVVEGDQGALVEALGGPALIYDRFETATVRAAFGEVDVARARAETYPYPGALPEVRRASIGEDLDRRDFTVNALAVPLADPGSLLDPHGGVADLAAGVLRVLHDASFVDDPTRALRAARYAGRLDLEPDPHTMDLLRRTDLGTVSRDRVAAELARLASEQRPRRGFELLDEWGLVPLGPGAAELIEGLVELLADPPWHEVAPRAQAVVAALSGLTGDAAELAAASPRSPSAAVAAARGRSGVELAIARASGADWLDDYVERWRDVRLEIGGEDLLAAGVPEGPRVGRGLTAALRAKLDGETGGRDDELRIALDAAGS